MVCLDLCVILRPGGVCMICLCMIFVCVVEVISCVIVLCAFRWVCRGREYLSGGCWTSDNVHTLWVSVRSAGGDGRPSLLSVRLQLRVFEGEWRSLWGGSVLSRRLFMFRRCLLPLRYLICWRHLFALGGVRARVVWRSQRLLCLLPLVLSRGGWLACEGCRECGRWAFVADWRVDAVPAILELQLGLRELKQVADRSGHHRWINVVLRPISAHNPNKKAICGSWLLGFLRLLLLVLNAGICCACDVVAAVDLVRGFLWPLQAVLREARSTRFECLVAFSFFLVFGGGLVSFFSFGVAVVCVAVMV